MDKATLDNILDRNKAQPVGHGYIDIIVSRDNYKNFIADLVTNGFKITSVSWWEWCPDNKEDKYGLGKIDSIYYNGQFSELAVDVNDFNFPKGATTDDVINEITTTIENMTISFTDETISFNESNWLTPGLWLDVPDIWRNKYIA